MSGAQLPAWQRAVTRAWTHRGLLACLLLPLALLFGTLAALRRALYRASWLKSQRIPAVVIVVGNVVAGGSEIGRAHV